MSEQVIDILSRLGSDMVTIADTVKSLPDEKLFEVVDALAVAVRPAEHSATPFRFVANSSLSGGAYPCSDIHCRVSKLSELASFSALYADEVYLQDPFEKIVLRESQSITALDRIDVIAGIQAYLYLVPLVEKGIVKFAQSLVCLCENHKAKIADPLSSGRESKAEKIKSALQERMLQSCTVVFDVTEVHGPFLEFSGPEDLVSHGRSYRYFFRTPDFMAKLPKGSLPYTFSAEELVENDLLHHVINPVLDDLFYQEWHSAFHGTAYLTDNETQLAVASLVNGDAEVANSRALLNGLRHSVPAVLSRDVQHVVRLREREQEAFQVYRDTLRACIAESGGWREKHLREMFNDRLRPELNKINKSVANWKSELRTGVYEKMLFGSGTVAVGLYAGVLPPDIGKLLAGLGGMAGVAGLLANLSRSFKGGHEAKKSDYYFLWKMSRR